MTRADLSFRAMGSRIRLIVDFTPGQPAPKVAVERCRALVEDFDRRLSRFRADSELCAMNADPRREVPASQLLRAVVRSGLEAAIASEGLVDPTLVGELEAAGYRESLDGAEPARLADALAFAPARRPAHSNPDARWREIEVDERRGVVRRPPGLRFDSGGTGKGLVADLVADELGAYRRFVVDCGGDLRIGGTESAPIEVEVENPLSKARDLTLAIDCGAVASSGIDTRIWQGPDGRYAHHLLDPSTGEPAWTGIIGATALAPTALEAETRSKCALLSGPKRARELLAADGGLIVDDHGETEVVGGLVATPRFSISVPAAICRAVAA